MKTSALGTRLLAVLAAGVVAATAAAQSAPVADAPSAAAPAIEYGSVAKALEALEAADGKTAIVTHSEGWVIVNEPAAAAQWSFTPPGHAAYPAVVRRVIRRGPNRAVSVETASLCEAGPPACAQLLKDFAVMNDRITQATRARMGQGSAPP
jgi:hypothetical protein